MMSNKHKDDYKRLHDEFTALQVQRLDIKHQILDESCQYFLFICLVNFHLLTILEQKILFFEVKNVLRLT